MRLVVWYSIITSEKRSNVIGCNSLMQSSYTNDYFAPSLIVFMRYRVIIAISMAIITSSFTTIAQNSQKVFRKGRYSEAERLARMELTLLHEDNYGAISRKKAKMRYAAKWITAYTTLAMVEKTRGNFSTSLAYFQQADDAFKMFEGVALSRIAGQGSPSGVYRREIIKHATRQVERARVNMINGNLEEAKTNLDETNTYLKRKMGEGGLNTIVYLGISEYFSQKGNYDSSAAYAQKYILGMFNSPNSIDFSIKELGEAYTGLSKTYIQMNDTERALKAALNGERYAGHRFTKFINGKNLLGRVTGANQVAETYRVRNDIEKALRWNNKSLRQYNKRIKMDTPEKMALLATQGQIFWVMGDTSKANRSFEELATIYFNYTQKNFSYLSEGERSFFYRNNRYLMELVKSYYFYQFFSTGEHNEQIARKLYEVNVNQKGVLLNASNKLVAAVYDKGDSLTIQQYNAIRFLKEDIARFAQSGNVSKVMTLTKAVGEKERSLRSLLNVPAETYVTMKEILTSIPDSVNLIDVFVCNNYQRSPPIEGRHQGYASIQKKESSYVYYIFQGNNKFVLTKNVLSASDLEGKMYRGYVNFARTEMKEDGTYHAFFDPITPHITSQQLLFSADGVYTVINPEILFDGHDYLIQRYNFFQIMSAKDLLVRHTDMSIKNITLIGSPDFTTLKDAKNQPPQLPGAESEVIGISHLVPPSITYEILLKRQATEGAVKKTTSPSIIHFATHGFFYDSEINDPMYTSGLVFATTEDKGQQEQEDGYLTAYEASNLTLNNTFLVVLSACETGQGTYEDSEGVWGLQRAFQVAGVRYLVMSLFKVDDQITALLMSEFYAHLFNGDDVLQAFKKAQNKVRETSDNPLHWGAFVIKGI